MALTAFLLKTIGISLSGVMAPGAVTAAAVAQGSRRRWAGVQMAIGHGIIEIPLIFLIMFGFGVLFQAEAFKIGVGLLGGAFLIWMGIGMLRTVGAVDSSNGPMGAAGPLATGLVLSISNPYFLLWWATVGLNLTLEARDLGWVAFLLFALLHWLCDLVWLTVLSLGSFHGTNIFGPRNQRIVLQVCGVALAAFGVHFMYRAIELVRAA